MKRYLTLILIGLLMIVPTIPVLASVVSSAEYLTSITITNNSSSSASNISAAFSLSTPEMINAGMLSMNVFDCVMKDASGNDIAFMPGLPGNSWLTWISSIGAQSQLMQYLYSKGATGGKLCYFPDTSGMEITDNDSSLELVDNFIIEQKGWLDTTQVGANITAKPGAFRTFIAGSGNITAAILSADNISPTSATGTSWIDPDDAWDDYEATSASFLGQASWSTNLTANHTALYCNSILVKLGRSGAYISTADVDVFYNGQWNHLVEEAADWDNWQEISLGGIYSVTAISIRFLSTSGGHYAYVYEVDFGQTVMVSVTEVESAEHTITTSLTSDNFSLLVSGHTLVWTTFTGIVPNTSDNWTFFTNGVMPWVQYLKIWR